MTEHILCFKESLLQSVLPSFSGGVVVGSEAKAAADEILNSDNLFFRSRPEAEVDPSTKQLIPYIVVKKGTKILTYRRTKKSGESRLASKRSLGFGGHINPVDGKGGLSYERCFWREQEEELGVTQLPGQAMPSPVALIYDPSTEVGKVHFGIAHILEVPDSFEFTPDLDDSIGDICWEEEAELIHYLSDFENWSQMLIGSVLTQEKPVQGLRADSVIVDEVVV